MVGRHTLIEKQIAALKSAPFGKRLMLWDAITPSRSRARNRFARLFFAAAVMGCLSAHSQEAAQSEQAVSKTSASAPLKPDAEPYCGVPPPKWVSGPPLAVALLTVRIDPAGIMHDPNLLKSSGDPQTDQKLLQCAQGAQTQVAIVNGKPSEVVGVVGFLGKFWTALQGGGIAVCNSYPNVALRENMEGDGVYSYVILKDGTTTDIKITSSSGHRELDQAAVECLHRHRFFPFLQDGRPVEVQREYEAHWRLHK